MLNCNSMKSLAAELGVDHIVSLDLETFYMDKNRGKNKAYSLRTMTYYGYVFHDLFRVHGIGWAVDDEPVEWTDMASFVAEVNALKEQGLKVAILAHNCRFDASCLCWRWGLRFDLYLDTMDLSKLDNICLSSSLKSLAERYWPDDESMRKGEELADFDGVYHLDPEQEDVLANYCIQDVHLMREIFKQQMATLSERIEYFSTEIGIIHLTLRGFVEPQFEIRQDLLGEVVHDRQKENREALAAAIEYLESAWGKENTQKVVVHTGGDKTKMFTSNDRYALLLKAMAITVPLKVSKTTHKMTYALGKSDPDYVKLTQAYPMHQPIWHARERLKSTTEASRAKAMVEASDMFLRGGKPHLPFFLKYYGAENTGRWSGGEKLNQQNLTRGGKHRLSMLGIDERQITVCDLSNIELRVNLWFCQQMDILERIGTEPGYDYYCDVASDIFGRPVLKGEHKNERQMGKAAGLGLGFAMSWRGYQDYLASGPLGMDPIFMPDAETKKIKQVYDEKHYMIKAMWQQIERQVLPVMADGGSMTFGNHACVKVEKDQLTLPSGRILRYPNTRVKTVEHAHGVSHSFVCDSSRRNRWGEPIERGLHKGLIIENIAQSLARDILAYQMVNVEAELQKAGVGWVSGSVHDEILALNHNPDATEAIMSEQMRIAPSWAFDMPLDCEWGSAREYSK
ncbi:hypothetical protein ACPV5S_15510 [Vibrio astriarenae]